MSEGPKKNIVSLNISARTKKYYKKYKFDEIVHDSVFLSTDGDVISETRKNTWRFNFGRTKWDDLYRDLPLLYQFIQLHRSIYLKRHYPSRKTIFYTWYDGQLMSLKFSIISIDHDLPFGCKIEIVESLNTIINNYMTDTWDPNFPLQVWTKILPDSSEIP